jgi:adenine-specific DNA-methyltransferase
LREAIDFYRHAHGWSNRLIAGNSLLVMNSLLEKEGLAGKVQMIYIDPPYGIKYGSNFQPFVNRRDVKDGDDASLTQEPEMVQAFRDTWELGIHSYLTYLRDRLLLARELLHESGSCFLQISDDNVHRVRCVMDDIFGAGNAMPQIVFRKTTGAGSPSGYVEALPQTFDYLVWYVKDRQAAKIRRLFVPRAVEDDENLRWVELSDGTRRRMTSDEVARPSLIPKAARVFRPNPLTSQSSGETTTFEVTLDGRKYRPSKGGWKTNRDGMERLRSARRLMAVGNTLCYVRYLDDFPFRPVIDIWDDTRTSGFGEQKVYVVQTNPRVIARCVLMTTDPGDLVLDPTCGSGTSAVVSEEWGRRWITCDTSRVAATLAKQRLLTTTFKYYELAHADQGVSSGFKYERAPHVTLKSIANADPPAEEVLFDRPKLDKAKIRVTGPFSVEAVPAPVVRPISEIVKEEHAAVLDEQPSLPGIGPLDGQSRLEPRDETAVARYGETARQREWRDELLKCGIRGRSGQRIEFARIEPLGGTRWLQCEGETKADAPQRVVVSFGPEFAPLEQRQVESALEEAGRLKPKPTLVAFAAFQFDPEAAKDIDETRWPGVTLVKVQMNTDLLTDDLKKKRASNESYWLVGQPDVAVARLADGPHQGLWQVEVHGFDYYNPRNGQIESGDTSKIAMWLLDTDYDGRSLFPRQVFFPMAGDKEGWSKLAKNLKAEIDDELIQAYRGSVSLPFEAGEHRRVAVKIVDDRGIESLKIVELETH